MDKELRKLALSEQDWEMIMQIQDLLNVRFILLNITHCK
jgi:hypothetical protein